MRTRSAVLAIPVLLIAGTAPFWDTKPAGDWALDEVRTLLTNSPWAQMMDAGPNNPAPVVQVYLATAEPMQLAEERMRAAAKVRKKIRRGQSIATTWWRTAANTSWLRFAP